MRVLFTTDLHGSSLSFVKAIRAANEFEVDLLLVGGDLSGKRLIPVVAEDGQYAIHEPLMQRDDIGDNSGRAENGESLIGSFARSIRETDLEFHLKRLEAKGYYGLILTADEAHQLVQDPVAVEERFEKKIVERLLEWSKILNERLDDGISCYWTGGNDDSPTMLAKLTEHSLGRFQYAEPTIIPIGEGFELLSCGFSNPTPFDTPRELPEDTLFAKLEELRAKTSGSEPLILNIHVPPANVNNLDLCEINGRGPVHVGSVAVRRFIERERPVVDFAGHIHEGKGIAMIGSTFIFNPGSNYNSGAMQAFVVDISPDNGVTDYVDILR